MLAERDLELLGLSGTPSEADVRRAYLRQVKLHSPERDPDGFKAVREAFERLKQQLQVQRWLAESASSDDGEEESSAPLAGGAPTRLAIAPRLDLESREPEPTESAPASAALELEEPELPQRDPEVTRELERLRRALEREDADGAAVAMTYLFQRPILDDVPTPSPVLALQTFMVLVERGELARARALLDAFEAHAGRHQTAFGGELAGRWKLAREVAAVCDFDQELARAFAKALRSGNMSKASYDFGAVHRARGKELARFMQREAPTLWQSAVHMIQSERPLRPSRFDGWDIAAWPLRLLLPFAFAFIRLCEPSYDSHSDPDPIRPTTHTFDEPSVDASKSQAAPVSGEAARQLAGSWDAIDSAVGIGDCQTVREQWPLYVAATRRVPVTDDVSKDHTGRVLAMCPELKELLETQP
jgi:hypothetical protein